MGGAPAVSPWGRLLLYLERTFAVVALVVFSRGFIFHVFTDLGRGLSRSRDLAADTPVVANSPRLLALYIGLYFITGILVLVRWRQILAFLRREKCLFLLLALATLSACWSIAPGITLARTVAMSGTTLFGLYLAARYAPDEQLVLLACAFGIVIACSIFAALWMPEVGLMQDFFHQGLWRGVFTHKNTLGKLMPLASLVFLFLAWRRPGWSWLCWIGFWSSLLLLVMSCSKASLAGYIILFTLLSIYFAVIRTRTLSLICCAGVLAAVCTLLVQVRYQLLPPILLQEVVEQAGCHFAGQGLDCDASAENRSPAISSLIDEARSNAPPGADPEHIEDATGRKQLWLHLLKMAREKAWLGYGFGGFWIGTQGPSRYIWESIEKWNPRDSHNGFLELYVELGLVGLGLFLVGAAKTIYLAMSRWRWHPTDPLAAWIPAVLLYVGLANIGSSDLFAPNYVLWILYASSTYTVHMRPTQGAQAP